MSNIGFIGLGIMGELMVRNLRKASRELLVSVIKGMLGGSTALNPRARLLISHILMHDFHVCLHQMDPGNSFLNSEPKKATLPLTSLMQQVLMALMNRSNRDVDRSTIIAFIKEMTPQPES